MYRERDQITNRMKLNLSKENIDTGWNWTGIRNQFVHKRTLNHWVYIFINKLSYCISFKEIINSRKKSNLVNAK